MYSAYKLNKQGDNIQPWWTPFPIWNQSVVPCPVLTVASWPTCRFLRRQERRSDIPFSSRILQFVVIHMAKGFSIVLKAKVGVFLEFSCFFYDPTDVCSLISGSSDFLNPAWTSGSSQFTYCWSLTWRILSITLLVWEMSATGHSLKFVHSLTFPIFGIGMKTDLFQWPLLNFPNLLAYWVQHFHSIIF